VRVFVFPLSQVVFFPNSSLPLNIFEPRYLQMVEDALSSGTPIAVGGDDPILNAGQTLGYGHPQVLERRPDGTLLIVLHGAGKARLEECAGQSPYFTFEATPIPEELSLKAENLSAFVQLKDRLECILKAQAGKQVNVNEFLSHMKSTAEVVDCYASLMVEDADFKQALLEENDINDRVLLLASPSISNPSSLN